EPWAARDRATWGAINYNDVRRRWPALGKLLFAGAARCGRRPKRRREEEVRSSSPPSHSAGRREHHAAREQSRGPTSPSAIFAQRRRTAYTAFPGRPLLLESEAYRRRDSA